MFSSKVEKMMNDQIMHEFYSAYMYLSFAAHFASKSLVGFENWMKKQAGEEEEHAMKFFDFINERGGKVVLQAIAQPPVEFDTPLHIFEAALEHEKKVTALINDIYRVAVEEKDYASQSFLKWFIDEQVEEEASATLVVDQLKVGGDNGAALLLLDHRLGKRD